MGLSELQLHLLIFVEITLKRVFFFLPFEFVIMNILWLFMFEINIQIIFKYFKIGKIKKDFCQTNFAWIYKCVCFWWKLNPYVSHSFTISWQKCFARVWYLLFSKSYFDHFLPCLQNVKRKSISIRLHFLNFICGSRWHIANRLIKVYFKKYFLC